jgi:hypothetical protein
MAGGIVGRKSRKKEVVCVGSVDNVDVRNI